MKVLGDAVLAESFRRWAGRSESLRTWDPGSVGSMDRLASEQGTLGAHHAVETLQKRRLHHVRSPSYH